MLRKPSQHWRVQAVCQNLWAFQCPVITTLIPTSCLHSLSISSGMWSSLDLMWCFMLRIHSCFGEFVEWCIEWGFFLLCFLGVRQGRLWSKGDGSSCTLPDQALHHQFRWRKIVRTECIDPPERVVYTWGHLFYIIAILRKGCILSQHFAETQWIAEEELEVLMSVLSTFYCNCSISNLFFWCRGRSLEWTPLQYSRRFFWEAPAILGSATLWDSRRRLASSKSR